MLFDRIRVFVVGCALVLSACGGGDGNGNGPVAPNSATVGAAGGTVADAGGAKVVVPPGALTQDVAIAVTPSSAGAPPLPAGVTALGPIIAFTPHGAQFAKAVTITVPFDPALLPAGSAVALYKTDATQTAWAVVAGAVVIGNTVSAEVTGFSFLVPAITGPRDSSLSRWWSFGEIFDGDVYATNILESDQLDSYGPLLKNYNFGPIETFADADYGDGDGVAGGQVYSSDTGKTFWLSAQAPNNHAGANNIEDGISRGRVGSETLLQHTETYRKLAADATLSYTISALDLFLFDGSNWGREPCKRTWQQIGEGGAVSYVPLTPLSCSSKVLARAMVGMGLSAGPDFSIAYPHGDDTSVYTNVEMTGYPYNWVVDVWSDGIFGDSTAPVFEKSDFTADVDVGNAGQQFASLKLTRPKKYTFDLSKIAVGQVFRVTSFVVVTAIDGRQFESYAHAFLRDPRDASGTAPITLESSGVEPVAAQSAPPLPATAPGIIGLRRPDSFGSESESELGGIAVELVRLGGTIGAVSVSLVATADSAGAGTDFTETTKVVGFADGEWSKTVRIPVVWDDAVEPTETVKLELTQPAGGATLGLALGVLHISDSPKTGVYTLGGTLSGLAGTGLVLGGPFGDLTPTANGPFTMPGTLVDGLPYTVRVLQQPANPAQVCTLTNASGVVAGANVTNVQVVCNTPAPVAGLDPSFGTAGKAFNGDFEGSPTAVALQSSGKIVVVGNTTLSRFNADGSLDTSFATGGHAAVVFSVDSSTAAQSVTVQPDDKILVVGAARVGTKTHMAVARYLADGTLDTAFGSAGLRTIDPYVQLGADSQNHVARRALVAADGKIYVAGNAGVRVASNTLANFAVARLNADGSLDTGYSGDGAAASGVGSRINYAYAIGVQTDGKVVLAGAASNSSSIGEAGIGLARFKTDGSLDTDNPPVPSNYGPGFAGISLVDPRGFLGTSGGAGTDVDMVMLPDDNLVVTTSFRVIDPTHGTVRRISLVRIGPSGSAVPGPAGVVVPLPAGPGPGDDLAHALVRLRDGKFVVVGQVSPTGNLATTADFAVLRFNADLTPDLSFGAGGVLLLDFFGGIDSAIGVIEQPDGMIVVVGSARNGTRTGIGMARLQ